jgi:surface antigen
MRYSIGLATLGLTGVLLAACASGGSSYRADRLNAADLAQISAATQHALEFNKTGEGSNWENAQSGHRGTVTPIQTDAASAEPCRRFQQTAVVGGRTRIAYDTACRNPDGAWYSATYSSLTGSLSNPPRSHRRYGHHYGYHRRHVGFHFGHHRRHRHIGHYGHYW